MSLDKAAQTRMAWLFAALVFFVGGGIMTWWPASRRIAELRAHTEESLDQTAAIAVKLHRARELRAAKARVRADLHRLAGGGAEGTADGALLQLLDAESRGLHVSIEAFTPGNAPQAKQAGPLVGRSVTLAVRGPFRSIVALLADLPKHDVLVGIDDASLQTALPRPRAPVLSATVHATLYALPLAEVSDRVRTLR